MKPIINNKEEGLEQPKRGPKLEDRWDSCVKCEILNNLVECIEDLMQQPLPLCV